MTLEELIRDRAKKGEMVHLSVFHSITKDTWAAVYAPAHEFGNSHAADKDPVEALIKALSAPRTKRKVTATVKPKKDDPDEPVTEDDPSAFEAQPLEESVSETAEDWLPKP